MSAMSLRSVDERDRDTGEPTDVAMRMAALRLDRIAAEAAKCPLVPARVAELSSLLAHQFRELR